MIIMVYSLLLWVMQDLYHQPYHPKRFTLRPAMTAMAPTTIRNHTLELFLRLTTGA